MRVLNLKGNNLSQNSNVQTDNPQTFIFESYLTFCNQDITIFLQFPIWLFILLISDDK